jgi:hypothetical protein
MINFYIGQGVKYRSNCNKVKEQGYKSWTFTLTDDDLKKINGYLKNKEQTLRLVLVLGMMNLNDSELAILEPKDIKTLINKNKNHFTITRKKNERAFRIIMQGSRNNSLKIPTNRNLF